jgi:beta-1,4-mannosyl-glycoprotein beta-1,4-N-acetylglucosaminyltransferase
MIIDCFPFFNELDILEIRLNELYDVVDYFVLVEASKTQSLIDKPFFFEENKKRYEKFLDKIVHHKVDTYPNFTHLWGMENYQRNCISNGILKINGISKNDIAIISDLDEIVSKKSIEEIKKSKHEVGLVSLDFFIYYMNFKVTRKWDGPVYTKLEHLNSHSPQYFRNNKNNFPKLETDTSAGWHLAWMGGLEVMYKKMFSCIEPHDKSKIPPYENYVKIIEDCVKNKKFFDIEYNPNGDRFEMTNFEETEYPKFLVDNTEKFERYFYK